MSHRNNIMFYRNPKENSVKPPWFIECSRTQAEDILKRHSDCGNVLIRPKMNGRQLVDGSYALSSVSTANGELKFVHYLITKVSDGFKLELQSKPPSMACLKDVMDYYIKAAGAQKHRAILIDPTVQSKKRDYENTRGLTNTQSMDEPEYLPMNCGIASKKPHPIQRRGSAPTSTKDYVNVPTGITSPGLKKESNDHFYLNQSELGEEDRPARDYVNMGKLVPPGGPGRSQSFKTSGKSKSFPAPGYGIDERDESDEEEFDTTEYLLPRPEESFCHSSSYADGCVR